MRKLIRFARTAFTAACGIVCLLLIGLWVRSYKTCDVYVKLRARGQASGAVSMEGQVYLFTQVPPFRGRWRRLALPVDEASFLNGAFLSDRMAFGVAPGSVSIVATHWLVVALVSALVALCWVPLSLKFTLRTLLLATTLLAVLLGAAMYVIK